MTERYLAKIILRVMMPVDEHCIMKVQEEVDKMTGIDVLGFEFEYFPPIGWDVNEVNKVSDIEQQEVSNE